MFAGIWPNLGRRDSGLGRTRVRVRAMRSHRNTRELTAESPWGRGCRAAKVAPDARAYCIRGAHFYSARELTE
jgi:hypothetical protein